MISNDTLCPTPMVANPLSALPLCSSVTGARDGTARTETEKVAHEPLYLSISSFLVHTSGEKGRKLVFSHGKGGSRDMQSVQRPNDLSASQHGLAPAIKSIS